MKLTRQQVVWALDGNARSIGAALRNRALSLDPAIRAQAHKEMEEIKGQRAERLAEYELRKSQPTKGEIKKAEIAERLRQRELEYEAMKRREKRKRKPRRRQNGRALKFTSRMSPRKAVGSHECST